MRRTVMIATAITMLVAVSAAYAVLNNYTASFAFGKGAGSSKVPAPIGFTRTIAATNAAAGNRAAPLVDTKTTIYGITSNAKAVPTCSAATILTPPKYDGNCPSGSLVATGPANALLGGTDLTKTGTACNTFLHVYNAGTGKLWYFFTTKSAADCGGVTTGQTPPIPATVKQSGKNLVVDVPLPPAVSTAVAGHQGLYSSLIKETLTWKKQTKKVKGKTIAFLASTGCKAGQRPWSVAYTATSAGGAKETRTVSGSAKC